MKFEFIYLFYRLPRQGSATCKQIDGSYLLPNQYLTTDCSCTTTCLFLYLKLFKDRLYPHFLFAKVMQR